MTVATSEVRRRNPAVRARDFVTRRPGLLRNLIVLLVTMVVGTTIFSVFVAQEDIILPWQHKVVYYADFSDASAVAPGQHQEIRVAGVHVGDIGGATITKGGQGHIEFQITDGGLKVYRNATALLQAKTPLNEMYVEFKPGTPSAGPLAHGQTIPLAQTQSPIEVDQILHHLGPNVQVGTRTVLEQTNLALFEASDYLPSDLSGLNTTMSNLQPVAAALATREAKIRTLVTELNQVAQVAGGNQGRLAQLLSSAQTTLTTLSNNDGALAQSLQDLPGATQALGTALPKVQNLVGQLNPLLDHVRGSATILPTAIDQLNATLKNFDPVFALLKPVIADGNPLVSNLRTYLVSANPSLGVLDKIGPDLNPLTAYVSYDMPWLNGFFFNTNSLTSIQSGNHPELRSLIITGAASGSGLCNQLTPLFGPTASSLGAGLCNVFNAGSK